jgi:uncharacterized protein (TIGR03118 family)
MGRLRLRPSARAWLGAAVLVVTLLGAPALAGRLTAKTDNDYAVHRLVSDVPGLAEHVDPNLVNGWGLGALPTSPWWVSDNGTDKSTLYTADGTMVPLVVGVAGGPTGLVANPGTNFVVTENGKSGVARFLFDTERGQILGWSPDVATDHAVVAADLKDGAIYKGLAISSAADMLYAADFHNGRVDVFDGNFMPVKNPGAFEDPSLPAGYAPFGIQNVGGEILVSYAKQDADREDEIAGPGRGFVDAYDQSGVFLERIASHGALNAPWGLAMAPPTFGAFGGDLLVGNFGDGRINAYERGSAGWFHAGKLRNHAGTPISIDGLWALEFGLGNPNNGPTRRLFFTAGPGDEKHGLFGSITTR